MLKRNIFTFIVGVTLFPLSAAFAADNVKVRKSFVVEHTDTPPSFDHLDPLEN
jgi:hypothetical protein